MTGPEHYREAERLAAIAADYAGLPTNHNVQLGQVAQVHAMLAVAAATALVMGDNGETAVRTYDEWAQAADGQQEEGEL